MKLLRNLAALSAALLLAAACAGIAYYIAVTGGTRLQTELLQTAAETAAVVDGAGKPIADISLKDAGRSVDSADLPSHVRQAFLTAEDRNFYRHRGLDVKGMARALLANLRARSFRQGASTISQQLVKNTHLSGDKTIRRKLREIKLALQLERQFTKDEILTMYLNTIYFGHACYGIESASAFYFGKDAKALSPAEGAMLAAVIRSPNRYSPFVSPEKCKAVRDGVLAQMQKLGFLSPEACKEAIAQPLPQTKHAARGAESYLDAVLDELESLPAFTPYPNRGGYTICTYMDADLQRYAEQLKTDADRSGKSLLILDNSSRGVLAWHATEGNLRRQPGSLLKPLAVYAPAIEENILSPCTPVLDEKADFGGYAPSNYGGDYAGWVSARRALSESRNVPAVRILNELGVERSERALRRLGLTLQEGDRNLSLALGGMTRGYTLPELAGAYAALACGGQYAPASFIRKVLDADGRTVYERRCAPQRALSENTAFLLNDMLQTAAQSGTAKKLSALPFAMCGKTGTCGNERGNTDAWAVAYTRDRLFGVWMGNADNTRTDITGGGLPCHYAMLLARKAYATAAPRSFAPCPSVVRCRLDRASYEEDHVVRAAAPKQPLRYTFTDLFRAENCPHEMSPLFAKPRANATLTRQNNAICIDLCHAEYYAYRIKRRFAGKEEVVFDGHCGGRFVDENAAQGRPCTYTVTPYYRSDDGEYVYGEEETLPSVCLRKPARPPRRWWERALRLG